MDVKSQIEVIKKERKEATIGLSAPRGAKFLDVADVKIGNTTLCFSRYNTESEWLLDSQFKDGWMPIFHHGEGSRCCSKKAAQAELAEMLDETPTFYNYGAWIKTENGYITEASNIGFDHGTPKIAVIVDGGTQWNPEFDNEGDEIVGWFRHDRGLRFTIIND